MYAIIASGGKQYKVAKDDVIKIEKLDAEAGSTVEFDKVLMLVDGETVQVGTPFLSAKVTAEVLGEGRADKVRIIKFRRRKHFMKRAGHRQYFSKVKITNIA
jgi:large subunit ribosomal protein L21